MLLDDQLTVYRQSQPQSFKKVDWMFTLTGLFLVFISLISLIFAPQKTAEINCWGILLVVPIYAIPLGIAFVFFLLAGGYALLNRVLRVETDYKMGVVHWMLTLVSAIVLLLQLMNAETAIHFSFYYLVNSMLAFLILFLFAQFVFLTNAFMGLIKDY